MQNIYTATSAGADALSSFTRGHSQGQIGGHTCGAGQRGDAQRVSGARRACCSASAACMPAGTGASPACHCCCCCACCYWFCICCCIAICC